MKILVDAHIGRLIVNFLRARNHDVLQASSLPPGTSDVALLERAVTDGRVVMTSDKDFGELVFRFGQAAGGIILLRIDVPHERERLAILEMFWDRIEAGAPGHFVVVASKSVRRCPLPTTQ